MRDPLARLSVPLRLWTAAALCLLPLGLTWSRTVGFQTLGTTFYGDCGYSGDVYTCTPDTYLPGTYLPGSQMLGADSSARVFLVLAAVLLAVVANRPRTPYTRRWARLATAAALFALVLAVAARAVPATLCLAAALALAAPPVWRRSPIGPVFGKSSVSR